MTEHVLFVVNNYPPRIGGVETHVQSLARALVGRGQQATVVTLADEDSDQVESGVRVIRIRPIVRVADVMAFGPLGTARLLRRLARETGVTVVSTHTRFFPMTWIGIAVARRTALPSVHTEHGSDFVASQSRFVSLASRVVDHTLGRRALRRATMVVGVSESVVSFVRRLAGRDARVFYNAIDLDAWRLRPNPADPVNRLVFVGRVVPDKGWDALLQAAHRLREKRTFEVHLFGGGPAMQHLVERVDELELRDLVTLHGRASSADVRRVLAGSVLVNLSTLSEGFQTTLLEAAAVGARIVSYSVPGIDALKADGVPIWVPSSRALPSVVEAIEQALAASTPTQRDGAMRRWGWESRARDYLGVVKEVRQATG